MTEPQWPERGEDGTPELFNTMHGGYLVELAEPHVWLYESGRYKRLVRVQIMRYPMHPHFYIKMEADCDYVWDVEECSWRQPWQIRRDCYDTPPWKGERIEPDHQYVRAHAAEAYVERMTKKHFPSETHVVEYVTIGDVPFTYSREGD